MDDLMFKRGNIDFIYLFAVFFNNITNIKVWFWKSIGLDCQFSEREKKL